MDTKEAGRRGGLARAKKLNKKRRLEISQIANSVKSAKNKTKKDFSTHDD